jgi:hypothetical protein
MKRLFTIILQAALFKLLLHRGCSMANCSDCWCEHYDKSKGNCDKCVKNENAEDKSDLPVVLKRRAVKRMELDRRSKTNGQTR